MSNSTPRGLNTSSFVTSKGVVPSLRNQSITPCHGLSGGGRSFHLKAMNGSRSFAASRRSFNCHAKAMKPGRATKTGHSVAASQPKSMSIGIEPISIGEFPQAAAVLPTADYVSRGKGASCHFLSILLLAPGREGADTGLVPQALNIARSRRDAGCQRLLAPAWGVFVLSALRRGLLTVLQLSGAACRLTRRLRAPELFAGAVQLGERRAHFGGDGNNDLSHGRIVACAATPIMRQLPAALTHEVAA
jgi:hypothetical protein